METKKSLENEELLKKKELLSDKELSEVAGGLTKDRRQSPLACKDACRLLKEEEWEKCFAECFPIH